MQSDYNIFWSVLIPLVMLIASIGLTFALYRHFARQVDEHSGQQKEQPSD